MVRIKLRAAYFMDERGMHKRGCEMEVADDAAETLLRTGQWTRVEPPVEPKAVKDTKADTAAAATGDSTEQPEAGEWTGEGEALPAKGKRENRGKRV